MNPAIDELGADEIWKEPVIGSFHGSRTTAAGLDAAEVQSRLKTFGPNDAAIVKRSPLWLQFLSRFRNPLVIILLVASGLSAATGDIASFVIVVDHRDDQHDDSISSRKSVRRTRSRRCAGRWR